MINLCLALIQVSWKLFLLSWNAKAKIRVLLHKLFLFFFIFTPVNNHFLNFSLILLPKLLPFFVNRFSNFSVAYKDNLFSFIFSFILFNEISGLFPVFECIEIKSTFIKDFNIGQIKFFFKIWFNPDDPVAINNYMSSRLNV